VKPSPKNSPSGYKSSKFSDTESAFSSPLKKLPAKTTPGTDPPKAAKASKLSDYTNAVSTSTSSLTELKKEKSGRMESSSERLKKLAEPKNNLLTDHSLSSKSAKMDHSRRRSTSQDTQIKKISAIMQLDQRKSATLPELKVKSPQTPEVVMKNAAAAGEKKEGSPAAKASPTQENACGKKNDGNIVRMNRSDDSVVIEKTAVMLENEMVSTLPVALHSERIVDKETSSDDRMEKPSLELEYTAIRAPPSPVIPPEAEDLVMSGPDDQGSSYEVYPILFISSIHGFLLHNIPVSITITKKYINFNVADYYCYCLIMYSASFSDKTMLIITRLLLRIERMKMRSQPWLPWRSPIRLLLLG
jgi:hypothetical protein